MLGSPKVWIGSMIVGTPKVSGAVGYDVGEGPVGVVVTLKLPV